MRSDMASSLPHAIVRTPHRGGEAAVNELLHYSDNALVLAEVVQLVELRESRLQ